MWSNASLKLHLRLPPHHASRDKFPSYFIRSYILHCTAVQKSLALIIKIRSRSAHRHTRAYHVETTVINDVRHTQRSVFLPALKGGRMSFPVHPAVCRPIQTCIVCLLIITDYAGVFGKLFDKLLLTITASKQATLVIRRHCPDAAVSQSATMVLSRAMAVRAA